jgi:hypothetical protein
MREGLDDRKEQPSRKLEDREFYNQAAYMPLIALEKQGDAQNQSDQPKDPGLMVN